MQKRIEQRRSMTKNKTMYEDFWRKWNFTRSNADMKQIIITIIIASIALATSPFADLIAKIVAANTITANNTRDKTPSHAN